MDMVEAHRRISLMRDRSFLEPWPADDENFVADAVGFAVVSGQLDEAKSNDELRAACAHGVSLYEAGVVSFDDLAEATNEAIIAFMEWYESIAPEGESQCAGF